VQGRNVDEWLHERYLVAVSEWDAFPPAITVAELASFPLRLGNPENHAGRDCEVTMPGGRPSKGQPRRHDELEPLAVWFRQALADARYDTVNAFLQRHGFEKNAVYGLVNASRLIPLETVKLLAIGLRRRPEDVERLWLQAKLTMEQRLKSEHREASRLTSWIHLPTPGPALLDLLEALSEATEEFPYRLLNVEPPNLSAVYVRQNVRTNTLTSRADSDDARTGTVDDTPRSDAATSESVLAMSEALNRHEHLIITGEPGAGKSTLGYHLTCQLSRIWLREAGAEDAPVAEPVIPLRIPARSLATEAPWSTVLAEAMGRYLGLRLVTEPSPHLFEGRVQGARWLIFIDGLDEIVDHATRATVIKAVARHCRPGSDFRLVITTRPLPDIELAPLRGGHVGAYTIEPFGHAELHVFAKQWFAAQDPHGSAELTSRFLHQVSDGRLQKLVRNPLLATIAVVAHIREPDRPLPTSRVDLYHRFCDYLTTDEISSRATAEQLRRSWGERRGGADLAQWLNNERLALADHLARTRLSSETPLLQSAVDWVTEHCPSVGALPERWEQDLQQLLISTGMFVYEDSGLRFLHHSLAEFLAARSHAAVIPVDFPNLDEWIKKGLKEAQRTFVLLTFVLWSRRSGHDIGLLLRRLLDGDTDRALFAGRLVAEAAPGGDAEAEAVVDRLIGLAVGNAAGGVTLMEWGKPSPRPPRPLDLAPLFEVLAQWSESQLVAGRLRDLVQRRELPEALRIEAALALGHVDSPDAAVPFLRGLSAEARSRALLRIAQGMSELIPYEQSETQGLLLRLASDEASDPDSRVQALESLTEMGNTDSALELAESLLVHPALDAYDLATVARILLTLDGHRAVEKVLAALDSRTARTARHLTAVAEMLAELGHPEHAVRLAAQAVAEPTAQGWEVAEAAKAWLTSASVSALDDVFAAVQQRGTDSCEQWAHLAEALADLGCTEAAIDMAKKTIANPRSEAWDVSIAAKAWLTAASVSSADAVLVAVQKRPWNTAWHLSRLAEVFAEKGCTEHAIKMARQAIAGPDADSVDVSLAFEAWVTADETALHDAWQAVTERTVLTPSHLAGLAQRLARLGHVYLVPDLAKRVLADPPPNISETIDAVQAWLSATGPTAAEEILKLLDHRRLAVHERFGLAETLSLAGLLDKAYQLWLATLADPLSPSTYRMMSAERLLRTGQGEQALEDLHVAITDSTVTRSKLDALTALAAMIEITLRGSQSDDRGTP
jgi:tetratricopeptide (TPR) repeat protein